MKYKLSLIVGVSCTILLVAWIVDILNPEKQFGYSLLIEGLKTLGVTGFAVAGLNLWIETEDWTTYFENRMKSIVIEQDYFLGLDKNVLDIALKNLMKARFKDEAVTREDGFLDHFEKNISKYIASPYREDISSITTFFEAGDSWLIKDKVEFVCRKAGGGIQNSIFWSAGEAKIERVIVYIAQPNNDGYAERKIALSSEHDTEAKDKLANGYSLEAYKDVDKLKICIESIYHQNKNEPMAWTIAQPGRNVELLAVFPEGYRMIINTFLVNDNNVDTEFGSTFVRIKYKGWLLPENGFVWHLAAISTTPQSNVDTAT
jgi:hypothetical protein